MGPSLGTILGAPAPELSLGGLGVDVDQTAALTAINLEYGLTRRVGLLALLPYVKNRVEVVARPHGTGNLGPNPGLTVAGARQRNGQVISDLQQAAAALEGELARCTASPDPACAPINADRPGAVALVQGARSTATGIGAVYGAAPGTGAWFVPRDRSTLQQAVEARLEHFASSFASFLGPAGSGSWVSTTPVGSAPLGATAFDLLFTEPGLGIGARPLSTVENSHGGDAEVGVKLLLLDTFGPPGASTVPPRGARVAVAGLVRLPTAQPESPDDFADLGTGDAQTDVELRAFADVGLGSRLWASAVVRYAIQFADRTTVRIAGPDDGPFPGLHRRHEVDRDLGDVLEVEIAPRFVPVDGIAISANYRFRSKGDDRFTGVVETIGPSGAPVTLDAAALGTGTAQREQRLGLAITFSTLSGYAARQARWPLDISLFHTRIASGSGFVARDHATGVALRVWRRLARTNPLRPGSSGRAASR
jgi:hypothetical protein